MYGCPAVTVTVAEGGDAQGATCNCRPAVAPPGYRTVLYRQYAMQNCFSFEFCFVLFCLVSLFRNVDWYLRARMCFILFVSVLMISCLFCLDYFCVLFQLHPDAREGSGNRGV